MSLGVVDPRAGRDYPGTWPAFQRWFCDDDACREFLEGLRWPDGFVCPSCGCGEGWFTAKQRWMCPDCGRQSSVTAGTIFHRTRTPLTVWFAAMWFVCGSKTGTSARGLQQMLGFGSYETAWSMLHKLRRAMVTPGRDMLGPDLEVELDETVVGGRSSTKGGGPSYTNKGRVAIAVERERPKGLGRVRMRHISNAVSNDIAEFAADAISPGSVVWTDGALHYGHMAATNAIIHESISMVHAAEPAHELLPAVHRVASLLKRWLAGTLHHGQSFEHLDYYLDEFTFRFNRRNSRSRGLLFYRLAQNAVAIEPHPLNTLIATQSDDLT